MHCNFRLFIVVLIGLVPAEKPRAEAEDFAPLLETIQAVAAEGKGHREAAWAWQRLTEADASAIPAILAALDGANPLAANWLRSAAETIADPHLSRKGVLPAEALEKFILDTRHDPRGRYLAFELLAKFDSTAADRVVPGKLNDPSPEFRRDAVQRLLDEADGLDAARKSDDARQVYLRALGAARDQDQAEAIVKSLEKLGHPVNLSEHLGFVIHWHLIGPFDNTANSGFDAAYPPEASIDLEAEYPGQKGEVKWTRFATQDNYGVVDLAKALGPHKGAACYAVTEFSSDVERSVELRLGTSNACKVWIDGQFVFGRDEYHRDMQPVEIGSTTYLRPVVDQYRMQGQFQPGKNTILLKVCQNEQTEDWAQLWQFQIRVCDATGAAILSTTRPPPATGD